MKRTRLRPGKKSIERGSTFKSTNPRRRFGKGVAKRFPGSTGFTQRVLTLYGRRCVICSRRATQAHHATPRQVILGHTRLPKDERAALAYDARNGVPVCEGCHGGHETGARRIPFSALPEGVVEWAEEHGFSWYIRKTAIYPR